MFVCKKLKFILLGTMLFSVSGCASIVSGTTQNVNIATMPADEKSNCTLHDEKSTYQAITPTLVTVKKGDGPLKVSCESPSQKGETTIPETLDPWYLGNILLGGVIGLVVDGANGAYQKYPEQITVPMGKK